ncbi:Chymotrypsin-1 [Camponotus floridanus]|uniref:chymotrypsin n=1 Tax=Camponotus floridanus TaxID=104421 RepID=E2ACM3_CAMFO|nr:chymotrypsin-2 [Camponotus floridanus]EFN68767.1 Chymotrypsin-1 [Camponotus floridanus]
MLLIFCILGVVAIHELSGVSSMDTDSPNQIPKIVGGNLAAEGEYPYQASLRYRNQHFCGGSVIKKRWILTAAHCLSGFNDTAINVVLGTNTLDKGGDEYSSIKRLVHPYYNSAFIRNDIGLIKLDKDIVFGDKVKPIALPTQNFNKVDYPATLSGWGTTSYPGETPNELQHIKLTVIDQKQCLSTSFRVSSNNICTLNKKGEGVCHGDSGGPLVADGEQIGVVSWGIPCAKGRPDVFTRIYHYMDWIEQHLKEDNSI